MGAVVAGREAFGVSLRVAGGREVVSCLNILADDVGFANPGALGIGNDDGDCVSGFLESLDEGEDVGR